MAEDSNIILNSEDQSLGTIQIARFYIRNK